MSIPAEIRARLGAIARRELDERSLTPGEAQEILDRWDALEAKHAEEVARLSGVITAIRQGQEAEHADRVWLTRDEAKALSAQIKCVGGDTALLDERIGEG